MIRALRSGPGAIFWALSAHSSKSRAIGDEGTLSQNVAITTALTATRVGGSPLAARSATNIPNYFPNHAPLAAFYGILPAVLWRTSHSKFFCSWLLLLVIIRKTSTFPVCTFEH